MKHPRLTSASQKLRKSMTPQELKLWVEFFKQLPITINRQKIIDKYIVDFYCAQAKLIIEVDGSQHYEESGIAADKQRDDYFINHGYTVLRYSNRDVNVNFKAVCDDIYNHIFGGNQKL